MTDDSNEQALLGKIIDRFPALESCRSARRFGSGLINDTWLITCPNERRFILQRLNRTVFQNPEWILENIRVFYNHLRENHDSDTSGLQFPEVVTTGTGEDYVTDERGNCWRAMSFIENSISYDVLPEKQFATETGFALGRFHRVAHAIDTGLMHDTLPGFHVAPGYLAQYDEQTSAADVNFATRQDDCCRRFIEERRSTYGVLEQARQQGILQEHVIHGDPKLNNILFDKDSGKAISIIDLDTLKPGLLHYDIGDCIRSCCNPAGESPADPESVELDMESLELILSAWLQEISGCLDAEDWNFIYAAIHLLPLELGTRFYTDHLAGDRYFRVEKPGQNLHRAKTQFSLVLEIEKREAVIRQIISGLKARLSE